MKALIELAVLAFGTPYLIRLCTGRRTIRIRLVRRQLPSAPVLMCVALGLIVLAAIGT
jgi:hypothetical protein